MSETCPACGHPTRSSKQRQKDYPGTLEWRGPERLCRRCYYGSVAPPVAVKVCSVCSRRLRGWGVRAAQDPTGVQRGDARRCVGCKYGNKEVLKVDELNEAEVAWVERNVPKDLHHYFGVTND